ncbi:MAG: DNA integrity scanning protein DisA nucleotide-binding domain protein [Candidatus Pacearchaeota archaeon]
MKKREVYKIVLEIAKNIAKQKKGAMFLITDKNSIKNHYNLLYTKLISGNYLSDPGCIKVIEKLATLDGAVIISPQGEILEYGARLKKAKILYGFGTRHATAVGITSSIKGSTAIIVSEESNLIKIFRNGRLILEMDSQEKSKSMNEKIISFLSEGDNALLAAAGASAAILGSAAILNPAVTPVIIVGGSVYLALKTAGRLIKERKKE